LERSTFFDALQEALVFDAGKERCVETEDIQSWVPLPAQLAPSTPSHPVFNPLAPTFSPNFKSTPITKLQDGPAFWSPAREKCPLSIKVPLTKGQRRAKRRAAHMAALTEAMNTMLDNTFASGSSSSTFAFDVSLFRGDARVVEPVAGSETEESMRPEGEVKMDTKESGVNSSRPGSLNATAPAFTLLKPSPPPQPQEVPPFLTLIPTNCAVPILRPLTKRQRRRLQAREEAERIASEEVGGKIEEEAPSV
jgi:hypothetical protein